MAIKYHLLNIALLALSLASSSAFVPQPAASIKTSQVSNVVETPSSNSAFRPVTATSSSFRGATSLSMAGNGNIFDRFTRVLKANVNNFIKSIEDPEKVINQAVTDMQTDLVKIRQAYAEVTASQRRLERQQAQADALANDWYNRAQFALTRGNEGLAREALARRQQQLEKSSDIQRQMDTQSTAMDRLYNGMQALELKIVEASAKKEQMIARARTAKTTQKVNDMISGITGKTSMDAFNRMEERVLALEAAAEVSDEMTTQMGSWNALSPAAGSGGKRSVEQEFRMLEASSAVDEELKKMKQGLLTESSYSSSTMNIPIRQQVKEPFNLYK